jgi:hypothetical protein
MPPQTPASAPVPETSPVSAPQNYISNPFALLWRGFQQLGTNVSALFGLIGLAIVTVIGPALPALIIAGATRNNSSMFVLALLLGLAGLVIFVIYGLRVILAFYLLFFANVRSEKMTAMNLFHAASLSKAVRLLAVSLLSALIIFVGLLLLIVPGIIAAYWLSLAPYVLIDQDCSVTEALKRSRQLVRGHGWEMFGLYGAGEIVAVVEYIPVLGVIVAVLLGFASNGAATLRYVQLRDLKASNTPAVPVSKWNYVAVLVGPIILLIILIVAISAQLANQPSV